MDKGDVHQDGHADTQEGHADQLGVVLVDDHVATLVDVRPEQQEEEGQGQEATAAIEA